MDVGWYYCLLQRQDTPPLAWSRARTAGGGGGAGLPQALLRTAEQAVGLQGQKAVTTSREVFAVRSTYRELAELGAAAAAYPFSGLSPGSGTRTTSWELAIFAVNPPKLLADL